MDENLFEMSIDDINSDKAANLAKEYHFPTIDDDVERLKQAKAERSTSVVDSDYKIR